MYPIYIPSKGRTKYPITAELLKSEDIDFKVVVDPSELKDYKKIIGKNVIAVENDNIGLPETRNFIKKYSQSMGEKYHWQLEDDISQFMFRGEYIYRKLTAFEVLCLIESEIKKYNNVSIASPDHNSWPPPAENIRLNVCAHHCVLVNNANGIKWRQFHSEDADYSLQSLKAGYCTILFRHLRFNSVAPCKHEGGQTPRYGGNEKLKAHMEKLAKEWPPVSVIVKPDGKPQLRFNRIWSTFKQRPILKSPKPFTLEN